MPEFSGFFYLEAECTFRSCLSHWAFRGQTKRQMTQRSVKSEELPKSYARYCAESPMQFKYLLNCMTKLCISYCFLLNNDVLWCHSKTSSSHFLETVYHISFFIFRCFRNGFLAYIQSIKPDFRMINTTTIRRVSK